jgi:hypothetical protein
VFVDVPSNLLTLLLNTKVTVPSFVRLILACLVSASTGPACSKDDNYTTAAALMIGQNKSVSRVSAGWIAGFR